MCSSSRVDPWPSIIAGRAIVGAMVSVTQAFEVFSRWLLAGYAAILALLLSRIDSISGFIKPGTFQRAAILFLGASAIALVAKYLASVVLSSGQSAVLGESIGEKAALQGAVVTPEQLLAATVEAVPYPSKWFVKLGLKGLSEGRYDGHARLLVHLVQLHSLLVFLESAVILWSGYLLVSAVVA